MDRAGDPRGRWYNYTGSRRVRFRYGRDRGWSTPPTTYNVRNGGMDCSPNVCIPHKVFTGVPPFSEFATPVVISKIMDGERPARPEAQELTDSMWDMVIQCWDQDPARRPTMTEVIGHLRELLVSSLSIEADLRDFFRACGTLKENDRGEKAQDFADRFDEVCRTERSGIKSSHHPSRFLTIVIFTNENASNIWGTCESCAVHLAFFHPRLRSRQHSLNAIRLPLPQAATPTYTRQPLATAPS